MARGTWLGSIAGFVAGFVVATLLHNYPKSEATRQRYCTACADYEEAYKEDVILGARTGSKKMYGGALGRLLREAVGEHEHAFTDWATVFPTFGVPEEHPEVARKMMDIQVASENPHLVASLEQAMRNDRARTLALVQKILAPNSKVTFIVLRSLEGDAPWDQKWAKVDAEVAKAEAEK